jgi:hypothetical protein
LVLRVHRLGVCRTIKRQQCTKEFTMRRAKGRAFSTEEVARISQLLGNTDMTLQEIAIRMSCAKSSIVAINQHLGIRNYQGRRSCWVVGTVSAEESLPLSEGVVISAIFSGQPD